MSEVANPRPLQACGNLLKSRVPGTEGPKAGPCLEAPGGPSNTWRPGGLEVGRPPGFGGPCLGSPVFVFLIVI